MNILGLSAFYHDSSCCLFQDGKLVAAASEERFTRIKHDSRLPVRAYRYCLEQANLIPTDLDCIAYYENPQRKLARQLSSTNLSPYESDLSWIDPNHPIGLIRENLGFDGKVLCFDHHASHAASAFYYSGFHEAAIFTVDGVGEWTTTAYATGSGDSFSIFETVDFPHSLGLLYATITAFLGFRVNNGEYKVMGLASYGEPTYLDQIWEIINLGEKGQYRLNMDYFDFLRGNLMYSSRLPELLRLESRPPGGDITDDHKNLARSLQVVTEEILLDKIGYLQASTGLENLAVAGGVGLNAVANRRIRREGPFKNVFFQPAAGDAGACLGAAALAHKELTGSRHTTKPLSTLFLGPEYANHEILSILSAAGLTPQDYSEDEPGLIRAVVDRLLEDKTIGWFQGRMEFGPRALGARSILANPMSPRIKDRINRAVKKRESFRPFAPVILYSHLQQHMDISHPTPFMIETCQVISNLDLPAITHVDGSARPQTVTAFDNPRLTRLLEDFSERAGCPILVNTSFNQRGEPIVGTPIDALMSLGLSSLDVLVIGDYIVDSEQIPDNLPNLLASWDQDRTLEIHPADNPLIENLYSFV